MTPNEFLAASCVGRRVVLRSSDDGHYTSGSIESVNLYDDRGEPHMILTIKRQGILMSMNLANISDVHFNGADAIFDVNFEKRIETDPKL